MMKRMYPFVCIVFMMFYLNTPVYSKTSNTDKHIDHKVDLVGVLTQGALLTGHVEKGMQVFLNDKAVKVSPNGDFVIGFGRDAKQHQMLSYKDSDTPLVEQTLQLSKREYKIQRIEGVPQKMVTPDPSKTARIRADASLVKTARKQSLDVEFFLQKFVRPVKGRVTGVYGSQRVFNGTPKRPHFGLDYAGPVGELVYAPASGVVTLVHDDMYYSGGTLIIDHGYGVSSTFLHLSELLVKEGDNIIQGDVIAKIGKSGRATGPHLDWRINWFTVRIDPQLVLDRYK